jgi:hypothetical protein
VVQQACLNISLVRAAIQVSRLLRMEAEDSSPDLLGVKVCVRVEPAEDGLDEIGGHSMQS